MCTCRGCYLLFSDPHAELRYRAVPDRYLASPTSPWTGALGALQIPVGLAFFFRNSALDKTVAFYPGPGRRHRVRTGPGRLGPPSAPPTPGLEMLRRDVEALLVRVPDRRARERRVDAAASATWCRSTPATSSSADCECCGVASTVARRCASSSTSSSKTSRRAQLARTMGAHERPDVHRADVVRRTVLGRPHDSPRARHHGPATTSRSRRSRCAARCASNRCGARTPTTRRRADRPVRAAGAVGEHPAHVPLAAQHRDGAGLHRRHRGRAAAGVHLRLRGRRRPSICTRCATAPSRCCSSSAERFSAGQHAVSPSPGVVGVRGPHDMPVAVWRDLIDCTTRTPAGCGSGTTPSPRWPPTSRPAACSTSTRRSPRCSPARRTEPRDPMTPAGTGPAPSPTRCSTRDTCCIPIGRRRARTSPVGSSAFSVRRARPTRASARTTRWSAQFLRRRRRCSR